MRKFISSVIILASALLIFAAVISKNLTSLPTMSEKRYAELPVIMYHSVLKNTELSGKYIITPSVLSEDMEYLKRHGYTTVTLKQLTDFVDNNTPLPEKPIMLTFDDGCYNNYEYVLPILKKYNAHAVFCIVGKYTDDYTDINEATPAYGYMRWIDVYNLMMSGHGEIANHSYNFHTYNDGRNGSKKKSWESKSAYQQLFGADTKKMQEKCEKNTGNEPIAYAYPFGAYSAESLDVLKEMGIRVSFTCNEGINIISPDSDSLFFLKRNNRPDNLGTAEFFDKLLN